MAGTPPNRSREKSLTVFRQVCEVTAAVVGASAIGRQLSLQLVTLGVSQLRVFDSRCVTVADVRSGGYRADDIGRPRVDAIGDVCHQTNPRLDFVGVPSRITAEDANCEFVFSCTTSMNEKRRAWNCLKSSCRLWGDVQIIDEKARVIVVADDESRTRYEAQLKARSSRKRSRQFDPPIYLAAAAASLAVYQLTNWTRGNPASYESTLDLASTSLRVGEKDNR